MFNLSFTDNGQKDCTSVVIYLDTGLPIERRIFQPAIECERQYAAYLLRKHLNDCLNKAIETAHKTAYEQGYRDGRGKKRKKTLFDNSFREEGKQVCY